MEANTNSSNGCLYNYSEPKYVALTALRAGISAISTLCILLVITAIFLFHKHHFFTQRLILYLAFSSLAFSIEGCMNVVSIQVYQMPQLNGYCVFTGFFDQVTEWWIVMAMFCIMLDIFIKVVSFKQTERLECFYVVAIFVLPVVLISWIPFIDNTYGPAGPICWIRSKNLTDCSDSEFGIALQFVLYYIPVFLLMITALVLLAVSIFLLRKKSKTWAGNYDHHATQLKMKMQTEVRPLFAYPIIIVCMNILPLVNRIYGAIKKDDQLIWLWYLSFTIHKLQGVIITVVFALDKETRKKLTRPEIMAALRRLTSKNDTIKEYLVSQEGQEPDSKSTVEYTRIQN